MTWPGCRGVASKAALSENSMGRHEYRLLEFLGHEVHSDEPRPDSVIGTNGNAVTKHFRLSFVGCPDIAIR